MDLLLRGGLVYDGSGAPPRRIDLGITQGRLDLDPSGPVASVIDVTGLAVCPGFVDIHTHSDLTLLSNPLAESKVRQGVTTEVVGNCGLGVAPIAGREAGGSRADPAQIRSAVSYLDLDPAIRVDWTDIAGYLEAVGRIGTALNVATFVPHLPVRAGVVGLGDRAASPTQIDRMVEMVAEGFHQGAVGLSTGLVYPPLSFAAEDELMALGHLVSAHDRLFAWHVKDYTDELVDSVRQAIRVARTSGCRTQISHLAAVGRRNWGSVRTVLAEIDRANAEGCDIAVDCYPYLAGSAPLSQLLPSWIQEGGSAEFAPRLRESSTRAAVTEIWASAHFDWRDIVISAVVGGAADDLESPVTGRTVHELAATAGTTPAEVALDLLARHGTAVLMVAFGRSEDDLRTVLAHPSTVVASDGLAIDPAGPTGAAGRPHPRSYGCFPRYLSRYAADLADGIRRCTSAAADRVGLADRGRIAPGLPADLIVFDPATLADTATFDDPQRFPTGIRRVLVGGRTVVLDGAVTGDRPGAILTAGRIGPEPVHGGSLRGKATP